MTRYQVCYTKGGAPLGAWKETEGEARKLAESLRKVGYIVQVWAHTAAGAKKTDI